MNIGRTNVMDMITIPMMAQYGIEHELYMTRMERDLLKKLEEVERRDAYRK